MKNIDNNILFTQISALLENARKKVAIAVNQAMVLTYFEIGRMIVEDEQNGKSRAEYGKELLKDLSINLTEKFGKGFSQRNLEQMRQFYLSYSITQTPSAQLKISTGTKTQTVSAEFETTQNQQFEISETTSRKSFPQLNLSWSHYIKLMRIKDVNERKFYEIESFKNNWSLRELQRQYDSALYSRLALGRNSSAFRKRANFRKTKRHYQRPLYFRISRFARKSKLFRKRFRKRFD